LLKPEQSSNGGNSQARRRTWRSAGQAMRQPQQMLIADAGAVAARNIRIGMIGPKSPNSSRVQIVEKRRATNSAWRCSAIMSAGHRKKTHHMQGETHA